MTHPHKLTTQFSNQEYMVLQRNGNEVTITRDDGQILRRHISHIKKIPTINTPSREPSVTTSSLEQQHVDNAFEAPSEEFIPRPGPSRASKRDTTEERVQPLKLKKRMECGDRQ
nr:unnamed protein product [Callosobruchus chinensis]